MTTNRFSDRLNKSNRMQKYAEDQSVAEDIVTSQPKQSDNKADGTTDAEKTVPEMEVKETVIEPEQSQPTNQPVAENREFVQTERPGSDDRLLAYMGVAKTKKIANSITLSTDVVQALEEIVAHLKQQGYEKTNKSVVVDELLRETLTDLGYLKNHGMK